MANHNQVKLIQHLYISRMLIIKKGEKPTSSRYTNNTHESKYEQFLF